MRPTKMTPMTSVSKHPPRKCLVDAPACSTVRERLIQAASEVFSASGYAAASTRDICQKAHLNNAAIHYYFGDKAAIYRELFIRILDEYKLGMQNCGLNKLRGAKALRAYYRALLLPLAENGEMSMPIHLYLREDLQPSGIVNDLLPCALAIHVELLGDFIKRELRVEKITPALQRLLLCLHGLPLAYVFQGRMVASVVPVLFKSAGWVDRTASYLSDVAWTLTELERTKYS